MKVIVIYGSQQDLAKLTGPVLGEISIEVGLVSQPVLVSIPEVNQTSMTALQLAMDESESDYAIVLTGDRHLSAASMMALQEQFPFIDGYRAAARPFHSATFRSAPEGKPSLH